MFLPYSLELNKIEDLFGVLDNRMLLKIWIVKYLRK